MNACFYQALDRMPLGLAVAGEFTGPLAVAIGGSRRRLDIGCAALAAAGVVLLTDRGGDGDVTAVGVFFAAAAGVFWAAYILVSKRIGRVFEGASGLSIAL